MSMLFTFAGLAMCVSVVGALLPKGGLRRTASVVMGLMLLAFWLESLGTDWIPALPPEMPDSLLAATGAPDPAQAQADLLRPADGDR